PPALLFVDLTAAPVIYTLSLHDALPISAGGWTRCRRRWRRPRVPSPAAVRRRSRRRRPAGRAARAGARRWHPPRARRHGRCASPESEEHTSELQSRENLVCRLLLEKKKK